MTDIELAIQLVQRAGEYLVSSQQADITTQTKGTDPKDLLTQMDVEIETLLINGIRSAFPTDAIHSEETPVDISQQARAWVIDPIDGTANFSRHIPHFAICLGLIKQGVPVLGAIYNPITHELFHFEKGKGAFLNHQPIQVSSVMELAQAHVFFHAGRKVEVRNWGGESYRRLLGAVKKTSNFSGSALDICFVAAGRIEAAVYGTLSTLDIAPALGLLAEAGGNACDASGRLLTYSSAPQIAFMTNSEKMSQAMRELLTDS